jgi:hypothetical protein
MFLGDATMHQWEDLLIVSPLISSSYIGLVDKGRFITETV